MPAQTREVCQANEVTSQAKILLDVALSKLQVSLCPTGLDLQMVSPGNSLCSVSTAIYYYESTMLGSPPEPKTYGCRPVAASGKPYMQIPDFKDQFLS